MIEVTVGPLMGDDKYEIYVSHISVPGHMDFELEVDRQDCIEFRGTPEDVIVYKLISILENFGINDYTIKRLETL